MRKTLVVLVMVGLAFVLIAGPVLAAGSGRDAHWAVQQGPKRKPHVISMTGTTQSSRSNAGMYVTVQMTNKPFVVKRGQTVWVNTSSSVCYVWSGKTRSKCGTGEPSAGQKVSINARVSSNGDITARRVEVNKPRYR